VKIPQPPIKTAGTLLASLSALLILALLIGSVVPVAVAAGGSWGSWIVDRQPTCTQSGQQHRSYSADGVTSQEYEDIPALGHDYQLVSDTPPSCTKAGERTYRCTRCGATKTESYGAALGHDYKAVVTTPATSAHEGLMTYTCTRCGDTYTEPIPKLAEHWIIKSQAKPTSKIPGYILYEDTSSGNTKKEPLPALGYRWGPWTTDKKPTLFAVGRQHAINENYPQERKYQTIPALVNLRLNKVDAVMAPLNTAILLFLVLTLLSDLSVVFWDLRKRKRVGRARQTKLNYLLTACVLGAFIIGVPMILKLLGIHISYLNLIEITALSSIMPLGIFLRLKVRRRLCELNGSRGVFTQSLQGRNIVSGN